jgi:The GLUG motif.
MGVILTVGFSVVGGFVGTAHGQAGAGPADVDTNANDLSGDGSRSNPYEISNASELQAMEDDLNANYELVSDIDASQTAQFNDGRGFNPVGGNATDLPVRARPPEFTGSFDGNGYRITGLTIDRPERNNVGLFGMSAGIVKHVTLTEVSITGGNFVGGLVGRNDGTIRNATASGSVSGRAGVGGLVGCNNVTIRTATASGNVDGLDFTGGLVGISDEGGMIVNATASGNVDGLNFTGGLVGVADENVVIKDATASGGVSGTNATGGLVGLAENGSTITNATASRNVDGSDFTGGLVGFSDEDVVIKDATASGGVNGSDSVGGLVGQSRGRIMNATACGNVDGLALTGGLVGFNDEDGVIKDATASGGVSGSDNVGGLAGQNNGTITTARALSNTEGERDVGGLVGANIGAVRNTSASGTVSADEFAGGLIGVHIGIVEDSFAVGNVTATADVGGLVGNRSRLGRQGTVRDSYFDEQATSQDTSAGAASELTTSEMQGTAAEQNMGGLEFGESWQTVSDDYPVLIALAGTDTGTGQDPDSESHLRELPASVIQMQMEMVRLASVNWGKQDKPSPVVS